MKFPFFIGFMNIFTVNKLSLVKKQPYPIRINIKLILKFDINKMKLFTTSANTIYKQAIHAYESFPTFSLTRGLKDSTNKYPTSIYKQGYIQLDKLIGRNLKKITKFKRCVIENSTAPIIKYILLCFNNKNKSPNKEAHRPR